MALSFLKVHVRLTRITKPMGVNRNLFLLVNSHNKLLTPCVGVQKRYIKWGKESKKKQALHKEKLNDDTRRRDKPISPKGPPMNNNLLAMGFTTVSVVDVSGKLLGTKPIKEALSMAKSQFLDLVLVGQNQVPPVCRLTPVTGGYASWGTPDPKIVYKLKKEAKEAKKLKQKLTSTGFQQKIKEIRFTENISEHDLQIKVAMARQALRKRFKVNLALVFKSAIDMEYAVPFLLNVVQRFTDIITTPPGGHQHLITSINMKKHVTLLIVPNIRVVDEETELTPRQKQIEALALSKIKLEDESKYARKRRKEELEDKKEEQELQKQQKEKEKKEKEKEGSVMQGLDLPKSVFDKLDKALEKQKHLSRYDEEQLGQGGDGEEGEHDDQEEFFITEQTPQRRVQPLPSNKL